MSPPRSRTWGARAAVGLLGVLLYAGCSHVAPYYRDDSGLSVPWADDADIAARVLFIGDAGEPNPKGEPALEALSYQVNQIPARTTVVYLGDNIYERGMPEPAPTPDPLQEAAVEAADVLVSDIFQTRQEAERIINAQVNVVRGNGARAIFLPGNHDWDQSNPGGWKRILALEAYLRMLRERDAVDVSLLPAGGCPGPVSVSLDATADLILLDTQWWLADDPQEKPLPSHNPTHCPYLTETAVSDAFSALLVEAAREGRATLVAAHHPLDSHGAHGGFVDGWTHLFPFQVVRHYVPFYVEWLPLPVVGSAVAGLRACCSPSVQDMPNGTNRHMRRALIAAMDAAGQQADAPLAYIAGHDHGLQVIDSAVGAPLMVVSGQGSSARTSEVGSGGRTRFAHADSAHPGFVQIDLLRDGSARLAVLEYAAPQSPPREMYAMRLRTTHSASGG
ncbi:MAG: metallophosphoesterase [Deltaproteobacteria bacterium]|nr:metallophosphoesterase [Deltaproteobacteria bacterium]